MDKALQTMIDNMSEKTGKSLADWHKILQSKSFEKHGEAVNFLKSEHAVTHGFANTIVSLSKEQPSSSEDLVALQYQNKPDLRPIYHALSEIISGLGDDVIITPKKASVSYIRKHQFALVKPATKTRIDLGLKLKDITANGRLEGSGPFGTMCTHRVRIESMDDLDQELKTWLKQAYARSV
jgi:predicted transport protein